MHDLVSDRERFRTSIRDHVKQARRALELDPDVELPL
jgi:hypothetical protein